MLFPRFSDDYTKYLNLGLKIAPNNPSPKQTQKRKFDNDLNDIIANKIEQQQETRRQSREWSQQNLKEIDEMYHNKNKLQSKHNNSQYANNKHNDNISSAMKSKADSVDIVCREFNESNISVFKVFACLTLSIPLKL